MNNEVPESNNVKDAESLVNRFSKRLKHFNRRGLLQRLLDWLYGYDYFISYKWSDGRIYALALAEQLRKRGFDCFLDSEDYLKGDNWKSVGERALKKTTRLVLVGSPEVHQSEPVLRELQVFTATKKRVIPINFDESLTGFNKDASPLVPYLDSDGIWIGEPIERLNSGPSPETINALEKSFKQQRQRQKRAYTLGGVAGVFVVLVVFAALYARRSQIEQTRRMVNVLTSDLIADDLSKVELTATFAELRGDMMARKDSIISEPRSTKILFFTAPTDMRKSHCGLAGLIRNELQGDPTDGTLFLFLNRRCDRIKALYWDRDGLALWYKRLEQGTFEMLRADADAKATEKTRASGLRYWALRVGYSQSKSNFLCHSRYSTTVAV